MKKILIICLSILVLLMLSGLCLANYLFDKYLGQGEIAEAFINGLLEDEEIALIDKEAEKVLADNELGQLALLEKGKENSKENSKENNKEKGKADIKDNTDSSNKKAENNSVEILDKNSIKDNNNKGSSKKEKISIEPTDKARVLSILKSALTNSDIAELKQIAESRPLTHQKMARAKSILKARLTKAQKEELKVLYRKYYS